MLGGALLPLALSIRPMVMTPRCRPARARIWADLAECRAQGLEALDDVADEVWELVDRLSELYQSVRAVLVDTFQPGGDGLWLDEEHAGSLGE